MRFDPDKMFVGVTGESFSLRAGTIALIHREQLRKEKKRLLEIRKLELKRKLK
jgi:hypothetical protein